jgi:hypothetical protein
MACSFVQLSLDERRIIARRGEADPSALCSLQADEAIPHSLSQGKYSQGS